MLIDRTQVREVVDLSVDAANAILDSMGFTIEQSGSARYDSEKITFKLVATLTNRVENRDEKDSAILGFSENIVGKSFTIRRTTHMIRGISLSRPKYPISTETQNGARYKFQVDQVKRYLGEI